MAEDLFPFLAQFLKETSSKEPVRTDKTMQAKVSSVLSGKSWGISQKNNSPSAEDSSNFFSETPKNRGYKTDKTLSGLWRGVHSAHRPEGALSNPGGTSGGPWSYRGDADR